MKNVRIQNRFHFIDTHISEILDIFTNKMSGIFLLLGVENNQSRSGNRDPDNALDEGGVLER